MWKNSQNKVKNVEKRQKYKKTVKKPQNMSKNDKRNAKNVEY